VVAPTDAVTDAQGNVYFTDRGHNVVRRVDAASGIITTVVGNGTAGSLGDGGPALLAQLHDPDGVALDASAAAKAEPTGVGRYVGRLADALLGFLRAPLPDDRHNEPAVHPQTRLGLGPGMRHGVKHARGTQQGKAAATAHPHLNVADVLPLRFL